MFMPISRYWITRSPSGAVQFGFYQHFENKTTYASWVPAVPKLPHAACDACRWWPIIKAAGIKLD
jgi:hypothetical protein